MLLPGARRFERIDALAAALIANGRQALSDAGHKAHPGSAVYAATKHAVLALSEGWRQEVKPDNIRTTVISPGAIATELSYSITESDIVESVRQFYKMRCPPNRSQERLRTPSTSRKISTLTRFCSDRRGKNCQLKASSDQII